jgi:tetratricopeptide (TPR) repeat protein
MAFSRDEKVLGEAAAMLTGTFGATPSDPEAINALAVLEWKLGKAEDAADRLEKALEKFPSHLQSSVTLARMKLTRKDWNGAEEVLKKAVADAPKSAPAAIALAELYLLLRQPAKAEPELNRALRLEPNNAVALRDLAALLAAEKRLDEAEQMYKRLSALPDKNYKPFHAMFLRQIGKRDAALAEFEALHKADPSDREARSRLVTAYVEQNRGGDAEKVLAEALEKNNKDTEALLQRAELRLRTGKTNEAEEDLRVVLHVNANSAVAHFLLAGVHRQRGQLSGQRQQLQETLRLSPEMLRARLALASSFLAAKQAKAALDALDQAPEPQKASPQWVVARNWALLELGNLDEARAGIDRLLQQGRPVAAVFQDAALRFAKKDYAGARGGLDELLKREVIDPNVLGLLMQTYAAQKDLRGGLERLRSLAEAKPASAMLQQTLGEWYLRAGNTAAARKAFEAAKSASPGFVPAEFALAQMELGDGQYGAAQQRLAPIVSKDPRNVAVLHLLARAQDASGDFTGAMKTYRDILAVDGSNVIALNNLAYRLGPSNPDEALKLAQQALELAPEVASVQDTLGWVYYHKRLYPMAVRYLKSAIDKEASPRRQYHLGLAYIKSGEQDRGRQLVREALLKDPNLVKTEQGW